MRRIKLRCRIASALDHPLRSDRWPAGDSYLVLHTYEEGGSKAKKHDLHFWIGAESTQDEYGR